MNCLLMYNKQFNSCSLSNCCVSLKYIDLLNDSCSFLFNKTSKYKDFIIGELHCYTKEKSNFKIDAPKDYN